MVVAARAQKLQIAGDRRCPLGFVAPGHPAVDQGGRRLRGGVLVDVVGRTEEVGDPRPGVAVPLLVVEGVAEEAGQALEIDASAAPRR